MVSKFIILSLIVCVANAATWRTGRLPRKPEHLANKEGCYIKEIEDVIPFGETVTPIGYCYSISCGTRDIDYSSCILVENYEDKCYKKPLNPNVAYPDCCPQYVCDSDNNIDSVE